MMNEKYNAPNSPCCGRPMNYAPANNCNCSSEPECPIPACIRKKKPDCEHTAAIPAITVESTDDLINYKDTLIHVINNNTTYYVDAKGRPMITWAGPVEYNNYDLDTNPLKLRGQILLDLTRQLGAYYDRNGQYQTFMLGGVSDTVRYAKVILTAVEGEDNLWTWQVEGNFGQGLTDFEKLKLAFNLVSDTQQHFYTEIYMDDYFLLYRGMTVEEESDNKKYLRFRVFTPDMTQADPNIRFQMLEDRTARFMIPQ